MPTPNPYECASCAKPLPKKITGRRALYCNAGCRDRGRRDRNRQKLGESRFKARTGVLTAPTSPDGAEFRGNTPAEPFLHRGVQIIPDAAYPGIMWRVVKPDGSVTDMVNRARAMDAAALIADRRDQASVPA